MRLKGCLWRWWWWLLLLLLLLKKMMTWWWWQKGGSRAELRHRTLLLATLSSR